MSRTAEKAYNAFINKKRFRSQNTEVDIIDNEAHMYLFDNEIAKTKNGSTYISNRGYRASVTTRDRLSKFVRIRKYKNYFIINERFKWEGEWLNINNLPD